MTASLFGFDSVACQDSRVDPEWFYGDAAHKTRKAVAICQTCQAKSACLKWALDLGIEYGVWGGKSLNPKRSVKRSKQPATPEPKKPTSTPKKTKKDKNHGEK